MAPSWKGARGFYINNHASWPLNEKEPLLPIARQHHSHSSPYYRLMMRVIGSLVCLYGVLSVFALPTNNSCDTIDHGYRCSPTTAHFWGQYSLWFSVPSEIQLAPPEDCEVTFANVLSRHGGRDPTAGRAVLYAALIAHIQNTSTAYPGKFKFLKDYKFNLGVDELTDAGKQEMMNSGMHFFRRYPDLVKSHTPFVRAGGQHRVVQSAEKWLDGIAQSLQSEPAKIDLVIPECSQCNNTLSHDTCPAFEAGTARNASHDAQTTWASVFVPPILQRVNAALGTSLAQTSIVYLMDMCPFDTLTQLSAEVSNFCYLFTPEEWRAYDYYQTLDKFYGYGVGHPLGPTQGVGYVNELLARLTESAVQDNTNTNSTLDSDPATFPLDRKVYADFSHDNDISGVLAALGLYNKTQPLSSTSMSSAEDAYGFSAAWTVPFASRMYVEKLQCKQAKEEFVRVIVNDRIQPLEFCNGDEYGRCTLSDFVESQSFARGSGLWDQCYAV